MTEQVPSAATEYIHTRLKSSKTHGVKLCLFDKEGSELYDRYTWSVKKHKNTFYLLREINVDGNQTKILFHRELLGLPEGEIRDHRNGNGLDNRLCNLRPATIQENNCNRGTPKNNTSGIKGVSWNTERGKWKARITYNGKEYNLGYFDDIKEAETVVRSKREELHGEFCNHG